MQPSACTTCGRPILWAKKRDNDKWNKPLDAMTGQNGFILFEGEVHVGTLYQAHSCKLKDVNDLVEDKRVRDMAADELAAEPAGIPVADDSSLTYKEEMAKMELERGELLKYLKDVHGYNAHPSTPVGQLQHVIKKRDAGRIIHHEVADARKCPYCKAKRGQLCRDVQVLMNKGEIKYTANAHKERELPRDKTLDRVSPL